MPWFTSLSPKSSLRNASPAAPVLSASDRGLTRRALGWGCLAALSRPAQAQPSEKLAFRFSSSQMTIQVVVEYFDRQKTKGFWFQDDHRQQPFCLSAGGDQNRNCMDNFHGSIAVAQYQIRPKTRGAKVHSLREFVRTVDRNLHFDDRPPFEKTIALDHGLASDIQAFGYEARPDEKDGSPEAEAGNPWYLFRQDLFLEGRNRPVLVTHWRHSLDEIRLLDIIPASDLIPMDVVAGAEGEISK